MSSILIIDDDQGFCGMLSRLMEKIGHQSTACCTLKEGLQEASTNPYELVLLDVRLPDGNGLEAIDALKKTPCAPEVIVVTGFGNPEGAELAIRGGAWDYIEKPASLNEIISPVVRALHYSRTKTNEDCAAGFNRNGIIGESQAIKSCIEQIARVARSNVDALLTGETGTGKDLFARAIHRNSPRADRPFVVVDCTALPATLIESLLFGHEKGAFTGAERAKTGLIRQADKGILFLDEVGELPLALQKSFLRLVQERTFRPLGGKREESSDFVVLAATNRDLDAMVESGQFRKDLLFRLRSFSLELPPLRDRKEDIRELAGAYLARICEEKHIATKKLSSGFVSFLETYDWPGNVRELFNALQSAVVTGYIESVLCRAHLPLDLRVEVARSSAKTKDSQGPAGENSLRNELPLPTYKDLRAAIIGSAEREYLHKVVAASSGNWQQACRLTGLSKSRFYALLQKYAIHLLHDTHQ
jgi:two-component system NtrC family response regulator